MGTVKTKDGVEIFYVSHTREQTLLLAERCAALEMLTTGSADYHGPENRLFNRFLAFERGAAAEEQAGDREVGVARGPIPLSSCSKR